MSPSPPSFIPICPHLTHALCLLHSSKEPDTPSCKSIHYHPHLLPHTDERLGDCSYLNACYRRGSCRYVHWGLGEPVDDVSGERAGRVRGNKEEEEVRRDEATLKSTQEVSHLSLHLFPLPQKAHKVKPSHRNFTPYSTSSSLPQT